MPVNSEMFNSDSHFSFSNFDDCNVFDKMKILTLKQGIFIISDKILNNNFNDLEILYNTL